MKRIQLLIILSCLYVLLTSCGGLTTEENATIDTVLNNTSIWYKEDTIRTQFVNYNDKVALEVWSLIAGPNPPMYPVNRCYYEIDTASNKMILLESEEVGIRLNRPLSNTDYYPINSSLEVQKQYLSERYKVFKK